MIIVVGDAGLDVLVKHDGPVEPGGDRKADVRTALGGAGANTAMWLATNGAATTLVGRVGDDPAGRQVSAELTSAGIRTALAVDPDEHTCCVAVLVDEHGQRTMLSDRGAGARLRDTDLAPELLVGASHLHLSGYVLLDESSRSAGTAMLAAATAAGLTTSVDPQTAARLPGFLDLVAGTDLLLPNTAELAALTGSTDPESATALLNRVGAVAVTMGAQGACWVDEHGIISIPAESVVCVDSTRAGDAFNAAMLAARQADQGPEEALRAGVTAGTVAVRHIGAQPPAALRSR